MNSMNFMAPPESGAGQGKTAHRLFFALQPDGPAAERIALLSERLTQRFGRTARPMAASRWHISLDFVARGDGPPPSELIAHARSLAATIVMPAFVVALDRVVSWKGRPGRRPLVLCGEEGVIGVERLAAAIRQVEGDGREREFIPHVTLLWGEHDQVEQAIAPVVWRVREFVLLHSMPGRQEVLGRWPLVGSA
ncbi:MAG: 2-5 ligase [Phenylobacterium sp.]|nr:2-5 ligase [Phenylobacterium sp.]